MHLFLRQSVRTHTLDVLEDEISWSVVGPSAEVGVTSTHLPPGFFTTRTINSHQNLHVADRYVGSSGTPHMNLTPARFFTSIRDAARIQRRSSSVPSASLSGPESVQTGSGESEPANYHGTSPY